MKIAPAETSIQNGELHRSFPVASANCPDELWFSLDPEYEDMVSERADAALVALLIPAMSRDEHIIIQGPVSERLVYTIQRQLQEVLKTLHPDLNVIDIHAAEVAAAGSKPNGVATGFSAGIDSFSALADHYLQHPPDGYKLTHLLYHNVGSHLDGGEELFRERFERILPLAESFNLPFIAINSNMDLFYDNFDFLQTHTLRNTAVALLLQKEIGRFMYSSAYQYSDIKIEPVTDIAYSDPITLPLLSTNKFEPLSVGSEYTRVEKTLQVAEIEQSHEFLDVCVSSDTAKNCSDCYKCLRTLLTLEIAGMLEKYEEAFDIDTYQKNRRRFMGQVLANDDPFSYEILEYAREEGFEFPFRSKFISKAYKHQFIFRIAKQAKKIPYLPPE